MIFAALSTIVLLVVLTIVGIHRHQQKLKLRAHLMEEAMRNGDYQFHLPTNGLLPGERAMQDTLNRFGETIRQQTRKSEVASWERLTRVLTHEIMNGMAPIASISQTLLRRNDVVGTSLEEGIRAIHQTADHLATFVSSYRTFSSVQKPQPQDVRLSIATANVAALYPDIQWVQHLDTSITVHTDPNLLHQTLINLTKNAIEADAHTVTLRSERTTDGRTVLLVSNDGKPIPPEARASIFIPFFTTKRSGSGIGLSLSRRIMTIQDGDLELTTDSETTFRILF